MKLTWIGEQDIKYGYIKVKTSFVMQETKQVFPLMVGLLA